MEHSSRLLIIIGAIVVSILIISIAVFIYFNSVSTTERSLDLMTMQEKKLHNDKFSKYNGRRNNIDVEKLITAVIQTNATASKKDEAYKVPGVYFKDKFKGQEEETEKSKIDEDNKLNNILRSISKRAIYDVKILFNERYGIVDRIEIVRVE